MTDRTYSRTARTSLSRPVTIMSLSCRSTFSGKNIPKVSASSKISKSKPQQKALLVSELRHVCRQNFKMNRLLRKGCDCPYTSRIDTRKSRIGESNTLQMRSPKHISQNRNRQNFVEFDAWLITAKHADSDRIPISTLIRSAADSQPRVA